MPFPMPRPMIESLWYLLVGTYTSWDNWWSETAAELGMVYNIQIPYKYDGGRMQAVMKHGNGRGNAPHATFVEMRERIRAASKGSKCPVGSYIGFRSTCTVKQTQEQGRYPIQAFLTSDFDPPNVQEWPGNPGFVLDKMVSLETQPARDELILELTKIITRKDGHPVIDVLHLDECSVGKKTGWERQKEVLQAVRRNANAHNILLSINLGGWNLMNDLPADWPSPDEVIATLPTICNSVSFEATPHVREGAFADKNYELLISRIGALMSGNGGEENPVAVELISQPHLLGKRPTNPEGDAHASIITGVRVVKQGGVKESSFPAIGQPGQDKLLLTLDQIPPCSPFPQVAPWHRCWIGDNDQIPGMPPGDLQQSASWKAVSGNRLCCWPKRHADNPEQVTNQVYVFDRVLTLEQLKQKIRQGGSSDFEWSDLVGLPFYDLTSVEAIQAATLLFAASDLTNHYGGVHYSLQSYHPGNLMKKTAIAYSMKYDWRKWGTFLGEPLDDVQFSYTRGRLDDVRREFENGVLVLKPKLRRAFIEA